jgi:hypothetical protein
MQLPGLLLKISSKGRRAPSLFAFFNAIHSIHGGSVTTTTLAVCVKFSH